MKTIITIESSRMLKNELKVSGSTSDSMTQFELIFGPI